MSTIDINKQYRTRNNLPVTILKTDLQGTTFPVVAVIHFETSESIIRYTIEGQYLERNPCEYDLIEYNPAQDLVLDQPIWVRNGDLDTWKARHFKEYKDNKVWCWKSGRTSHTCKNYEDFIWDQFTTTNPAGTEPSSLRSVGT